MTGAPAADVFRWHEQPEALRRSAAVASIRADRAARRAACAMAVRVTFSIGIGPLRMRWDAAAPRLHRRRGDSATSRFADRSRIWRHAHLIRSRSGTVADALPGPRRVSRSRRPAGRAEPIAAAVLSACLTLDVRAAPSDRARGVRRCPRRRSVARSMGCDQSPLPRRATLLPADARRASDAEPVRTVDARRSRSLSRRLVRDRALPEPVSASVPGDVRATYARRPDGRIDVVNRCRTADGHVSKRRASRASSMPHVGQAEGAVRARVALVPAVRVGRLLDYRPAPTTIRGPSSAPRTATISGSWRARRA